VPEVLRNGISGILANEFDDLVQAVKNVESLSREGCRTEFEIRFTADVMATQYEHVFHNLIRARRDDSESAHQF
jgi:hypothetical protein